MTDTEPAEGYWAELRAKKKAGLDAEIPELRRRFERAQDDRVQRWREDYQRIQRAYREQGSGGFTVTTGSDGTVRVVHGMVDIEKNQQSTDDILAFSVTCWRTPAKSQQVTAGKATDQPRTYWRWEGWCGVRQDRKTVVNLLGLYYAADASCGMGYTYVGGTCEGPCPACGIGIGNLPVDPVLKVRCRVHGQRYFCPASRGDYCPGCPDTDES